MYIYKTINCLNGKIYVGLSKFNPEDNPEYFGSGFLLKRAIECYGRENFKKTIIEECNSKEELCERERYWIITLKANTRGIGYNICEGGTWGDNLTNHPRRDELRANQSMRMKGRKNSNYGNRWSKEQREAASARRKQNPTVIDKETGLNIAQLPHNRKKNSESKMGLDNPNGKLWRLISPIGEEFVIEGGIKRELKRFGLNHRQFQIGVKINENTRVNKNGWVLVRNEKPTINGLT